MATVLPVKSGDTLFIGATNSSYSADGSFYVATTITQSGGTHNFGACGPEVSNCMALGVCHNAGTGPFGQSVQGALTLKDAQGSPNTKWQIIGLIDIGSTFVQVPDGTPIRLGSFVAFRQTMNGTTMYWQTGPSLKYAFGLNWNDTVQLTTNTPFDTDSERYYRVWIPVQTVPPFTGIFESGPGPGNLGAFYGTAYWYQSLGKYINNNNYQYATLNNTGYDCILSTQAVKKNPSVGDLGPAFIFYDLNGQIPLTNGKSLNPPTPIATAHWWQKGLYVVGAVIAVVIITFVLILFIMIFK